MTAVTFARPLFARAAERATLAVALLAVAAGYVVRRVRLGSRLVPGLAGAGLASWGTAMIYRPAGLILGGVFLLAMDRQITVRSPRE